MDKSIHTTEYAALLELLRQARISAGVTQVELAARLRRSQSFVSKVEVGETRLDLIQLRAILKVLGTTLPEFVGKLEARISSPRRGPRSR
jgi:transcriptional regulator with XRE-family HTH domain